MSASVLVTGGAGFVGSNLVDALLDEGYRVAAFDDLSSGRRENLTGALARGAELIVGDVADRADVDAVFSHSAPALVFHLAAQVDVRHSVSDPVHDAVVNVTGTLNVLEAARATGAARVVFASTGGALYGETSGPVGEDHPVAPKSPYGQSKAAAEAYCHMYSELHGLSTVALRFGNVYGPRQNSHLEGGVVAIFAGRLRAGERPLVYGDGEQTRDYIFVGDAVEAFVAAGRSDVRGPVNVATGTKTSVLELVEGFRAIGGGVDFEPEFAEARAGEILDSCLDPGHAARVLGWVARTPLRDGLRRTYESLDEPDS